MQFHRTKLREKRTVTTIILSSFFPRSRLLMLPADRVLGPRLRASSGILPCRMWWRKESRSFTDSPLIRLLPWFGALLQITWGLSETVAVLVYKVQVQCTIPIVIYYLIGITISQFISELKNF